jgi:autotransporter-associated beta strand protein
LSLRTAANLTWSGTGSTWDLNTTADWLNGATPSVFNFGDNVTFEDTGAANGLVTLSGPYLSALTMTVNSGFDYVFQGSGNFAGLGQFRYIGGGHLTMNNANSYSGGTLISNATAYLVLNNYNSLGTGPVTLGLAGGQMELVNAGAAGYGITGDINVADDFTITYDASSSFGAVLLGNLNGTSSKTLTINYNNVGSAQSRVRIYGVNTVYDAGLTLTDPRTVWAPYQPSGTQIYNGVISGAGMLIQRGNGTTILNGLNTYSGGTTPTAGTIGFGVDSTVPVTAGPIGTGPLLLAPEAPNLTGSGTVLAWDGARNVANPIQYPSATNNLTLIIGGSNNLTFSGPISLNGNDGSGSVNRTFQVTSTGLATFSSAITDGGLNCGLTKTGAGVLALDSTETYAGPTAVNAGTLQINGQLAAGAVTVATNGTLGGTGSIGGAVTVQAGGTISPGDSIGTITINNNLTLSGNLLIEVNKSASPASDKVVISGVLTNAGAGTVTVTNLGPALAQNDSFTLFSQPVLNGGALRITGGGSAVTWTNKLALDGTIAVLSVVPTTPTNITFSVAGGALSLTWPANYIGWTLEAQTNAPGIGITTNWVRIPSSTSVNQMSFPIGPANGTVFFRLVYP